MGDRSWAKLRELWHASVPPHKVSHTPPPHSPRPHTTNNPTTLQEPLCAYDDDYLVRAAAHSANLWEVLETFLEPDPELSPEAQDDLRRCLKGR